MPRHKYKKTKVKPDKVYNSFEVAKLINYLMLDGEKTVTEKIVYETLDEIKKQGLDPLRTLHQAIDNTSPNFEVKPRRLGGASYLVPIEVRHERRLFLAINWIINAAKSRTNKEFHSFSKKLLAEIIEASKNQGQGVAKKQATEKLAETNKAFAHLKW
jgi:small subunit ribosomal protein S7